MSLSGIGRRVWDKLTYRPFWREYGYLALCLFGVCYKIFGEVRTAEIVPNEFTELFSRGKNRGSDIIIKLALFPAEHTVNSAVFKQRNCFFD